jgi:arabinogalactan endo-1,4-beta-galactosidase
VLQDLDFDGGGQTGHRTAYAPLVAFPRRRSLPAAELVAPLATGTLFWRGVDVSHFDESMAFRASPTGEPAHLMAVVRDCGVNTVRLSAWVGQDTPFSTSRVLRLARQAAGHGLRLCLVLHYSDTWADPSRQRKPAAWQGHTVAGLGQDIYQYTKGVLEALCSQGTPPAIVQAGNEVTHGMLWAGDGEPACLGGGLSATPNSRDGYCPERQWDIFTGMLRQAVRGVRDGMAASEERARIMLHLDTAVTSERVVGWLEKVQEHDVEFDAVGLSYYAFWHRRAILSNLSRIGEVSPYFPDKELVVAETAYPHRPYCHDGTSYDCGDPPFTPEGQHDYLERALGMLRRLPNGTGLFWWGAAFVNGAFGHCADCFQAQALFDSTGVSFPALQAFKTL